MLSAVKMMESTVTTDDQNVPDCKKEKLNESIVIDVNFSAFIIPSHTSNWASQLEICGVVGLGGSIGAGGIGGVGVGTEIGVIETTP